MPGTQMVLETVAEAIAHRRSIRSYAPTDLDEASVRRLIEAAVQAPTAMHAEPWLFAVVQDRAALRRYSDKAKAELLKRTTPHRRLHEPLNLQPRGAFARALRAADFNVFYDAGTLIVIAARPSPFVEADCWLAAENLMLMAEALGLGTCCIGCALPGLNAPEVKTELALPADATVFAAIVVGVPAEKPAPVPRKAPVIVSWRTASGSLAPASR